MDRFLKDIDPKKPINLTEYAQAHKEELEDLLKTGQSHWMDLPNVLRDPAVMKEKERHLDMAYKLQAEVKEKDYPMDYNYRQEHMGEKYHELMEGNVALFQVAIMEQLDKYNDVFDIFKNNRNDPDKLRKGMESLVTTEFSNSLKSFVQKNKNSKDPEIRSFVESYKPYEETPSSIQEIKEESSQEEKPEPLKPRSKEELMKRYGKK